MQASSYISNFTASTLQIMYINTGGLIESTFTRA
jgi:hypothetical protein